MKKISLGLGVVLAVLLLCCTRNSMQLPQPENPATKFSEDALFEKGHEGAASTTIFNDGNYTFTLQLAQPAATDQTLSLNDTTTLKNVVTQYNSFMQANDYLLLPQANYTFNNVAIKKEATSTEMQLQITGYTTLPQGNYVLPLQTQVDGRPVTHLVIVRKDVEYVPLSAENKKPMPPGTYNCANRTEPMKMVTYVETNDFDIRNLGQLLLKNSKKPVFDIVVLFAANMNYDVKEGKRVLVFNDRLQPIVRDPEKYIKPLKDRGIKVLIDILPNHQGVGYANFQNYEEALDFAKQCKTYADKLGIDGWDIDEEYADYQVLPSKPVVGLQSYFWFMRAMKEVMPDKLLTLYDYAHPINAGSVDENGKNASFYLDYSWANYFENHGSYAGLPKERYGKQSIEANSGLYNTLYYATSNIKDCFGLFMFFNIQGPAIRSGYVARQLSAVTRLYYGEDCIFTGNYHYGPEGK